MTTTIKNTLHTMVAKYVNVELTDSDMKKLAVATTIAKKETLCNIFIKGVVFTVRWFPCEDFIKYAFHKEGHLGRCTSFYYDDKNILHIEDIKPYKK